MQAVLVAPVTQLFGDRVLALVLVHRDGTVRLGWCRERDDCAEQSEARHQGC